MKFRSSIVRWDRALVVIHRQRLVEQKYSGEPIRCIRCAKVPLNCYWSNCWTIKHSTYKSLVPRLNCAVCARASLTSRIDYSDIVCAEILTGDKDE